MNGQTPINIDRPAVMAPTDYAGNGGDVYDAIPFGPSSYADGDTTWGPTNKWATQPGSKAVITGIFGIHFNLKPVEIIDGSSHTYLIAERYVSPDVYNTGTAASNDQGWDEAYDFDVARWTVNDNPAAGTLSAYQPIRDQRGNDDAYNFGSAHAQVFNAVFCDGSVHPIRYNIDLETHRRLGSRKDRQPIDSSLLW
jgi:hypothetical protein